ncbi:zinc finger and SCAN domain-containing protein 10-like isoform X1 [Folsomia candida]|uniref:zinc finger and SCAN domain-containing protein 10-like isoform X1 n=1 Tax=Folsomia candida TaxID=158441 RepID=UPI001604D2E6|nr:zinc finger and SCAN domain-containing protein 10-like isoform X1 [Folsomia candida]
MDPPKPGNKWECSKCSKTFKTNSELTRHIVTHDPSTKAKCEVCGSIFKHRFTLSLHVWRVHTNRKRPKCDACHRVFFDLPTLRHHIETIHSTKDRPRFSCTFPGCEKTYLNQKQISHHVKTAHSENPARFPCILCGKEFKTRSELNQHIPTRTTEKPCNCAICGRGFPRMAEMKRHMMTHLAKSDRDVLNCHICLRTFVSGDGLNRHIRAVHEKLKSYPWLSFSQALSKNRSHGKRFSYSSHLIRHVGTKHATNRELIHSCDKCEYRSHSKHNLATHKTRHISTRHVCYFCGKKFLTFVQLVSHCGVHTLEKYL